MSKITDTVQQLISPIAEEMGFEIVDIEYKKDALTKRNALTVYIYHENGVDLDLLEKVHNRIDPTLDTVDISSGEPYDLNVSSPGLDRPLKTDRDFERNLGNLLEVKFFAPVSGKKTVVGELVAFDSESITIKDEKGVETSYKKAQTAKISQAIIFD